MEGTALGPNAIRSKKPSIKVLTSRGDNLNETNDQISIVSFYFLIYKLFVYILFTLLSLFAAFNQ